MTREEAIDFGEMWLELQEDSKGSNTYEFFKVATQALKQESCDDEGVAIKSIATAFQFGIAMGFAKKYDEMDKVMEEVKKIITPQPKMGCEGCIYEKTGNNSTYPCSHCGRCYTDKYKTESEG